MKSHIRACLILLGLTLGLCCIIYPLILFGVGGALFPSAATGSMVAEKVDGKDVVRGSRLIGQPFTAKEYFWPRPSATATTPYNATASGASNYGASNPKLRDRVAQQLGPLVVYRTNSTSAGPDRNKPRTPQEDIEAWYKTKVKQIKPVASDSEIADGTRGIAANFFEMWLRDPANQEKAADLEPVIADMVMASGSGLDPDITQRNALSVYQLDRVARERTPKGGDVKAIRDAIEKLVRDMSFTPLSGLIGEPLVNVFDLNRALDAKYPLVPNR